MTLLFLYGMYIASESKQALCHMYRRGGASLTTASWLAYGARLLWMPNGDRLRVAGGISIVMSSPLQKTPKNVIHLGVILSILPKSADRCNSSHRVGGGVTIALLRGWTYRM